MRNKLISWIVWLFYRTLSFTWRQHLVKSEDYKSDLKSGRPIIFAMWHGDEIGAISFSKYFRLATLTSTSKDGELMDSVLKKLGFETSRGSSTRGGARALKGLIRLGRSGRIVVIPVDGPKGPIHKCKPGVFEVSRLLGARIFPVGIAAGNKHIFEKSWNKTYLPLPFSRVSMVVGKPIEAVQRSVNPKDPDLANRLAQAIHGACDQARAFIDSRKPQ